MLFEIPVPTFQREEIIDITEKVEDAVKKSGAEQGICLISCPHTSGAITINENVGDSIKKDIIRKLAELVPGNEQYVHDDGNADAHIKSSLLGHEKSIIINDGKLLLGQWQGIFFFEGSGPRKRTVHVKIMKD